MSNRFEARRAELLVAYLRATGLDREARTAPPSTSLNGGCSDPGHCPQHDGLTADGQPMLSVVSSLSNNALSDLAKTAETAEKTGFFRPRLEATAMGRLDPIDLVSDWIEDIRDVLDESGGDCTAQEAYTLLATFSRLRRGWPIALLQEKNKDLLFRAALVDFANLLEREATAAVVSPLDWKELAGMDRFSDEFENLHPALRVEVMIQVLQDWDDAALVRAVARPWWDRRPGLEEQWQEAKEWLYSHLELFLPASYYIQNVAIGLRLEPAFAETTEVWVKLLDLLEQVESENRYEGLQPFTAQQIRNLL